jgi:hypothetical protein
MYYLGNENMSFDECNPYFVVINITDLRLASEKNNDVSNKHFWIHGCTDHVHIWIN